MANPEPTPPRSPGSPGSPGSHGALTRTARIAGGAAAESRRVADLATAEAQHLSQAVQALTAALGGGPPAEIAETTRRAETAGLRLEQARIALHEAAEALAAFLHRQT